MARLVLGMNVSLDGYVDHDRFSPEPALFRHFTGIVAGLTGSLYGRGLYQLMQYWDADQPGWGEDEHAFARAYRAMPKWVASRSLRGVGPHATLLTGDLAAAVARLKADHAGEIAMGGPVLAQGLAGTGLIDAYRLYVHPVVLGHGRPLFRGPAPPLRLLSHDRVGGDVVCLTYAPG